MDTPNTDGHTPRQIYIKSKEMGIPTPLDTEPEYPTYFQSLLDIFWDICLYKPQFDEFMPLTQMECYMRLFDVKLHPYQLTLLFQLDRIYTKEINNTINERTPKEN